MKLAPLKAFFAANARQLSWRTLTLRAPREERTLSQRLDLSMA